MAKLHFACATLEQCYCFRFDLLAKGCLFAEPTRWVLNPAKIAARNDYLFLGQAVHAPDPLTQPYVEPVYKQAWADERTEHANGCAFAASFNGGAQQ